MSYNNYYPATILEWKQLLKPAKFKNTIINNLKFLVTDKRITLYAFVIMSNHIHLIWQISDAYKPKECTSLL